MLLDAEWKMKGSFKSFRKRKVNILETNQGPWQFDSKYHGMFQHLINLPLSLDLLDCVLPLTLSATDTS